MRTGNRSLIGCIAVVVLLAAVPRAVVADLIVNGSFESPVVGVGSFADFGTNSTFSGWTVVGAPGAVSIISGAYTEGGFHFPAEDAAQWLDLTGDASNTATGVQQSVATIIGATYNLSFYVGNIVGGGFGTTSTVNLRINGTPTFSAVNSENSGTSTLAWEQFSLSFTATSSTTTVAFLNGDPATDNSNGLDNIVMTPAISGAPEPTTWPAFAIGVAVLLTSAGGTRKRWGRRTQPRLTASS
jgi:hypothetical protein